MKRNVTCESGWKVLFLSVNVLDLAFILECTNLEKRKYVYTGDVYTNKKKKK